MLALNSFWLARNPVRHFEPCDSGTSRGILVSCVTQRGKCRKGFLPYSEVKWPKFWVLNSSNPKESRENIRSEKKFWNCRDIWAMSLLLTFNTFNNFNTITCYTFQIDYTSNYCGNYDISVLLKVSNCFHCDVMWRFRDNACYKSCYRILKAGVEVLLHF